MAEHTRGPWKVYHSEITRKHCIDTSVYAETPVHKNPYTVCTVRGQGPLSRTGIEERDANALLIAAAPDLLAALERLSTAVDNASSVRGRMTGEEGRALDNARAAIRKARGV